ncbi:unnamed protein product [Zymoseptoria tritici ST99CH_1E4]|uniref:Uncharacterized protein n=1 Tax=Zymoseptoria tritici ST99CH_1E4 TaxID=1276532 RepID=A0A2H1FZX0_ZYMTR|nr:unnamed protein product [Zymoseptoria tritici ST99CH_1E4]
MQGQDRSPTSSSATIQGDGYNPSTRDASPERVVSTPIRATASREEKVQVHHTPKPGTPPRGPVVPETPQTDRGHHNDPHSDATTHVSATEPPSSPPATRRIDLPTHPLALAACLIKYRSDHGIHEAWLYNLEANGVTPNDITTATPNELVWLGVPPGQGRHLQQYVVAFMAGVWDPQSVFDAML